MGLKDLIPFDEYLDEEEILKELHEEAVAEGSIVQSAIMYRFKATTSEECPDMPWDEYEQCMNMGNTSND